MNDTDLLQLLRSGRDHKAFVTLYGHLPKVERMVRNNSGTRADAKDIFQEALIILHRKANSDGFVLTASIGTFLFAICRNLWHEELRKRKRFVDGLNETAEEDTDLSALIAEESRFGSAERALRSLGDKCLDILKRFYISREDMRSIANALGFAGEGAAKTRKYKCLEEARKRFRELVEKEGTTNLSHS